MNRLKIADILEVMGIEPSQDAEKAFSAGLGYLLYLDVGDEINVGTTTFKRLSSDTFTVNQDIDTGLRKLVPRLIEVDDD